jgi:DNA polymerase-3 subunit epsilon/CBS domain-containing protein
MGKMKKTLKNLNEAHRIIFNSILEQQLLDLEAGIPLSNRVAPASLDPATREQLSWALEQVPNVSNLLGDPLSRG